MQLNLTFKLVIGYSLMALLLLICGLVGYNATKSMSQVSDFLVTDARDTVQGALETSNGIRAQIKVIDDLLAGRLADNFKSVQQSAKANTEQAYNTMLKAGLIPAEQTERLNQANQAFSQTLNQLISSHAEYQQLYGQLISNADRLKTLLTDFNELANRIIVERETNWDTDEAANSQQSDEWFAASAATEAKLALFAQLYYYQRFLASTQDQNNEELIKNSQTDLDIYIEDLSSMELAEQEQEGKSFGQHFTATHAQHKQLYADARRVFLALNTQNQLYTEQAQTLLEETRSIEAISSDIIEREIEDIRSIRQAAFFSIIVTVIIGIVIVIVSYWLTHKTVVTPVRQVAAKLDDISKGEADLTQQLEVRGSDEIAALSRGFNEFTGQIRLLISQLVEMVTLLSNNSDQLAQQSSHTQQQMQAQQNATDSVNLDMDDMSSRVDDVSDAASTAEQSMNTVNSTLQQSQQVISTTLNSIHEFGTEIESAAQVVEQLNQDSQQVVSVVDVIQGIAEQTNLLALNAAIEAARAGEQGRGFAVVADEVRTLASRTRQSTTEIQEIIERLQSGTEQAYNVMISSREKATQTIDRTGTASESLTSITNDIHAMDGIIKRITQAALSQNEKKASMQSNLVHISEINQQTNTSGAHLADITRQLNDLSSQLSDLVGRFKV